MSAAAWTAWAIGVPGFAALSMAMERHREQVFGRRLTSASAWPWRTAGCMLLFLSLFACARAWSPSVAITAWLGALSFAAVSVGLLLAYRARWLLPLSAMLLALAAALALSGR